MLSSKEAASTKESASSFAIHPGVDVKYRYQTNWSGVVHEIIDRAEDAAHNLYELEEELKKKLDDRLFPNELLYCEGMPRPALRGILHLICSIIFPCCLLFLLHESHGKPTAQFASTVYILGNLFCCSISALFHVGKWSPSTEILLQKLDHMGIAVCSSAINFPAALLLLPSPYNYLLAGLSTVSCAWTCWNIANKRPGVWRLCVNASIIGLFFYQLFRYYMTPLEVACVLGNTAAMLAGVTIFVRKWPDPWPSVFGFHEVFHVFTVIGFVCVFFCNWSIVHRTSNPYAYRINVWDIVIDALEGRPGPSLRGAY